jgi:hypothetical protein
VAGSVRVWYAVTSARIHQPNLLLAVINMAVVKGGDACSVIVAIGRRLLGSFCVFYAVPHYAEGTGSNLPAETRVLRDAGGINRCEIKWQRLSQLITFLLEVLNRLSAISTTKKL